MNPEIRNQLRQVVLASRAMLEQAVANRLEGRFSIYERSGRLVADRNAPLDHLDDDERALRSAVLAHFHELERQGTPKLDAFRALRREVAFTWLNRFVAFKMLEARKLIRETLTRWDESNGYKFWLASDDDALGLHDRGGEHREGAYHRFLLSRCTELDREIHVLFDPTNLSSRLAPPPRDLRRLADLLNAPNLADAWRSGNEEALGWVYQFFVEAEKSEVFDRLYKKKQKIDVNDVPAATQIFTPNWMVRFLVHNTLGQLWFEMHPDSTLGGICAYRVPSRHKPQTADRQPKSVKDIRLLDPACGTMHFGLVAFDLFVAMYREEMAHVGKPGWPEKSPVAQVEDIPAAILAHNLHGIDIDLRAVQISALTLYLKAKVLAPKKNLGESRLACANIHMLNGDRLGLFLREAGLERRPIYRRILQALQEELQQSEHLGSLLPLERRIKALVQAERQRYDNERQPLLELLGWSADQFETEAGQQEFWSILEIQIGQALDAFARDQAEKGVNQGFFAGETVKGLRLLELLAQTYDVVVMNPPYLSARNMNATLKTLVAKHYPEGKGDLYAAFLQRGTQLLSASGRLGALTQQSFLFISSYEKLRDFFAERTCQEVMGHVGPRAFDEVSGEKVNTTLLVLRRCHDPTERAKSIGTYFRLVKEPDADSKRRRYEQSLTNLDADPIVYRYRQADFAAIPDSPWVYWITPGLRQLFETLPKLGDVAQPRQGLATADNFRFLRYWWEVGTPHIGFGCTDATAASATQKRWIPYMKGGSFRRWYGNQEYVVNWENNGAEIKNFTPAVVRNPDYYFRRGVTWTDLTSGRFSARLSPGGFIFDVKGSSAFPTDVNFTLAVLNSSIAHYLLTLLNPTVSFQVGDLARLPIPQHSSPALEALVEQAIQLAKQDSEEDETTWDFVAPPPWPDGLEQVTARHAQLAQLERQIDEEIYRLYGISPEDRASIEAELTEGSAVADEDEAPAETEEETQAVPLDRVGLAQAWLSFAVGKVFAEVPFVEAGEPLAERVLTQLESLLGENAALDVVRTACGDGDPKAILAKDLAGSFCKRHTQQYRKRPIYWLLQPTKHTFGVWLNAHQYDGDLLFKVLQQVVEPKIRQQQIIRLESLRSQKAAASGREAKRLAKEVEKQEDFLSQLRDFEDKLRRTANLHLEPDLNDGVVLNIAPLWELVPWKEAKKYWDELMAGEYEWSSIGKQLREKGLVE